MPFISSHSFRFGSLLALVAALALFSLSPAPPAHAATINVTTTTDELNSDGDCSLREAVQAANTDTTVDACGGGSGADTIDVPAGIYTLTIERLIGNDNFTGDLNITGDLSIDGAGKDATIIEGCAAIQCLTPDRLLHIHTASTPINAVTISDVTIRQGDLYVGGGGGIFNESENALTIINSRLTENQAGAIKTAGGPLTIENSEISENSGGGILNFGAMIVTDSAVSENGGGGILNYASGYSSTITNATIEGNSRPNGAGIYNTAGDLTVTSSIISGNNSAGSGGGIVNTTSDTMTIINSIVEGNSTGEFSSGGGIHNYGALTLIGSTVTNNLAGFGAGIYNTSTTDGAGGATVTDSTVNANVALEDGGGIYNTVGTVALTNSTVSGNSANGSGSIAGGGGIRNESGALTLTNSTVTGNASGSGAGIKNSSLAGAYTTTLENTIIANSGPGGNCEGAITSTGHNLISDATCAPAGPGDLNNTNPMLGPLANNGGPTKTHALLAGSPAIDAGSGDCPPPATDQRGVARAQDGDGNSSAICDIGAFEVEASGGPVGGVAVDPPRGGHSSTWAIALAIVTILAGTAGLLSSRRR